METTNFYSGAKIIEEAIRSFKEHNWKKYLQIWHQSYKKVLLLTKNINVRKRYYNTHKEKSFDNFKNFIFTDDFSYQLLRAKVSYLL